MQTVRVKVLYFGPAKEMAGKGEEFVQLQSSASLQDLLDQVIGSHQKLAKLRGNMQIAVNQELTKGDVELKRGDEVAFLPPVAGG